MGEPIQAGDITTGPRRLQQMLSLVIQIVVAVVLFLAIGAAAVLLNLATDFCDDRQFAPPWVIFGMRGLETLIWMVDVVCAVLFVLREAVDFCYPLIQSRRRTDV
jgi:hypothetical protein